MIESPRPRITAIIKPTFDCNLHCSYCYEGARPNADGCMNLDTLRNTIIKLGKYHGPGRTIHLIWHGGEPTLMGEQFFARAVEFCQEMGPEYRFEHCLQSNLYHLSGDFVDFLKMGRFHVGTSLDGPQWLHDSLRPCADGTGSFKYVLSTIRTLENNVKTCSGESLRCGAVTVLTKKTLPYLDEVYDFFRAARISFKAIPLCWTGRAALPGKEELRLTPTEYGQAMIHLFDRWFYENDDRINVDPPKEVLGNIISGQPRECVFQGDCYRKFLMVSPSGDIFSCGRWSSEQGLRLGNINEQELEDILASPVLALLEGERKKTAELCSRCEFYSICNGGCIDNSFMVRRSLSDRDYYCEGYLAFFEHVKGTISVLVRDSNGSTDSDGVVELFGKTIETEAVSNPNLRCAIKERMISPRTRITPEGYTEHEKTQYSDWAQKHDKYSEVYKEKWHAYRDYNDHSRVPGY